MAEAVGHRPDATDVERLAAVATLAGGLAPDVTLAARGRDMRGRDAVLAAARAVTLAGVPLRVTLDDLVVHVDGDVATVEATAVVQGRDDVEDYVDVELALARAEGGWLVTAVRERAALDRPPDTRPGAGSTP